MMTKLSIPTTGAAAPCSWPPPSRHRRRRQRGRSQGAGAARPNRRLAGGAGRRPERQRRRAPEPSDRGGEILPQHRRQGAGCPLCPEQKKLKELEVAVSEPDRRIEAKRKDYRTGSPSVSGSSTAPPTSSSTSTPRWIRIAAASSWRHLGSDPAAAVIVRLKSRQASDILSEMEPKAAAEIANR